MLAYYFYLNKWQVHPLIQILKYYIPEKIDYHDVKIIIDLI